jgi:hypothetical protein
MAEVKHIFRTIVYGEHQYTKRELFSLTDGGKIYLDFEGDNFLTIDDNVESNGSHLKISNPVLFICPGLTDEG